MTRLALVVALAAASQACADGAVASAPRASSGARLELARALGERARLRDSAEDERARVLDEVLSSLRDVRARWPDDARVAAEAAFRAGELQRAAGHAAEALAEFTSAHERGAGTPFRARAGIEIGHVHRRAERLEQALHAYEDVSADPTSRADLRDEASLWAGAIAARLGRARDALHVWSRVAADGEDPLDRIRAWDELACALVERGDLEGAAGTLQRCRAALAHVAQEETELGARVRRALGRMRALEHLRRGIATRYACGVEADGAFPADE